MQRKVFNPNIFVKKIVNEYNKNTDNYYVNEMYNFIEDTINIDNIIEINISKNKFDNFYNVVIRYKRVYDNKVIEAVYNIHPKYIHYVYYIQQKI